MSSADDAALNDASASTAEQVAFERERRRLFAQLEHQPLFAKELGGLPEGIVISRLIVGSRFIPVDNWRVLLISAVAGALAGVRNSGDLVAAGTSAAASTGAALYTSMKKLNSDELTIVVTMQRLSAGNVYRLWLLEDKIIEAVRPQLETDRAARTLANLESKGVLEEGAGRWRAVR